MALNNLDDASTLQGLLEWRASRFLTHVFWHKKSVPENVGAQLLRRIWPNTAAVCVI